MRTAHAVITLLTDFGTKDYFVPSMKGVILSINPGAVIVDITHDVPKFNVFKAAFILYSCYKYFPKGTIHVVVVDPGVGTKRRAIAIRTRNYIFIGPDNGVLMLAAEDDGIVEVREISNKEYMLGSISTTFHGRDIFAPAAAHLSLGKPFEDLGPELKVDDLVKLPIEKPKVVDNVLVGHIVYIDSFGNAMTNITGEVIREFGLSYGDEVYVNIPDARVELRMKFLPSYGHAKKGEVLCLINSENLFELAINQGSFAETFKVREGYKVEVRKAR